MAVVEPRCKPRIGSHLIIMKKHLLLAMLGVGLIVSDLKADLTDTISLVNSIHQTIERAVGAKIDDQIPGYSVFEDQVALETSGIECPASILNVKQAVTLLKAKLTSDFANRIAKIQVAHFPPGDDTELVAKLRDGAQVVDICITVFKRSTNRVILIPVVIARSQP